MNDHSFFRFIYQVSIDVNIQALNGVFGMAVGVDACGFLKTQESRPLVVRAQALFYARQN